MEGRNKNASAPSMKAKHMPKSLHVYTNSFGPHPSDRPSRKHDPTDGESLGFDSPLIVLLPVETAYLAPSSGEPARLPTPSFEFCFGTNGSKTLEEFFTFVRAKGITVIREPGRSRGER